MVFLIAAALVLGSMTAAGQQPAPADPAQPLAFAIRYADGRVVRRNIGPTHSGSHTFRMNVSDVPQPELLAITSVAWTDGTFEGDARPAALQWCRDAAGRTQISRILAMLRAVAGTDLTTALARLEAQADGLDVVALPAMVADATSRLPHPPPLASHEVAGIIAFQLQRLKKEFIGEIVMARPRAGNPAAVREWFDAAIAAYAGRLAALSVR